MVEAVAPLTKPQAQELMEATIVLGAALGKERQPENLGNRPERYIQAAVERAVIPLAVRLYQDVAAAQVVAGKALALLERFCRDRLAQSTASKIQAAVAEAAVLLEPVDLVAAESLSFETQGRWHKTEALAVLAK